MLDYARKMRLAMADKARRVGLTAAAAIVVAIGAGFLLAALWTWLAYHLDLGSALASLVIGGGFTIVGLMVLVVSGRERHHAPSTQELRDEIEQKLGVAADVVMNRVSDRVEKTVEKVQTKASQMVGMAENRIHSLADQVSYRADRLAEEAEWKANDLSRKASEAAAKVGLTAERVAEVGEKVSQRVEAARNSNLAAVAPVIGAFAIGMTLASRLQQWRHRDEAGDMDWEDADGDWDVPDDEFHDRMI